MSTEALALDVVRDLRGSFDLAAPRLRRPEPLTWIDRVLLKPMPFDTLLEWRASLPTDTQLALFHSCAHCGRGMSAVVPVSCNHCGRWLTRFMVFRDWWTTGWWPGLFAVVLRELNYALKEARRRSFDSLTMAVLLHTTLLLADSRGNRNG